MDKNKEVQEFIASVSATWPPAGVSPALVALWHDRRGDWEMAHRVAQDIGDDSGAWVHAYLHRKEGDIGNARYWYRHAGRPEARGSLEDEWLEIVRALLDPIM